ncbi:perlucin-like protein [Ruditapes philippinarum]|uniref:perlucin-like protein n=1 Tax=Ruditapes philippinarum TaxID=129788 RepID=UPI00295C392E|nr:perlucin-like protein [Ruditapes philippinarum]
MHYLTSFSLIMGIVGALIVRSDCQCSCTDIEVIKHLLQEMFEIKQEVYKLRSETDSIKVSCPDVKWKQYGNKCYRFIKDPNTWSDAKEKCRLISGDLVRIESKEENDFIVANIKGSTSGFWIGLDDTQKENNWQWSSSEGTQSLGKFSNWAPGEPNNDRGDEDCGEIFAKMSKIGKWNDAPCSTKLPYICEIVKLL